MTHITFNL